MPFTKSGRYYKIVNGKRQYNPKYNRAPVPGYVKRPKAKVQRTMVIRGKGDYVMNENDSFGKRYGGLLGSKAGELLGGLAQSALSSIVGLGDYSVNKNVFLSGNLPQIMNESGGGGTVIRFQEYLGDIITSSTAGAFKIQSFNVNAADSITFPWLSQIAANYEQYEMEGCVFQFRSTSADALNSTNTALGSVMMATQYDSLDKKFDSKSEMLNYEFSTSCKPCENCLHMIECAPRASTVTNLYTLGGALPAGADPRLYHLGVFNVATTGFQGTSVNIGELHVTYQVRLLKPKLTVELGGVIDEYFSFQGGAACYNAANPLGTRANVSIVRDTMGVTITPTTISWIPTNAKKYYMISVLWQGDAGGGSNITYPVVTFTNCTQTRSPNNAPSAGVGIVTMAMINYFVQTDGNGLAPMLTFGTAGVLPGNTTGGGIDIRIFQRNPAVAP